ANIRADYNARAQARQERAAAREAAELPPAGRDPADRGPSAREPTAPHTASAEAPAHAPPRSMEDIRREARENWLRMRAEQGARVPAASTGVRSAEHSAQPRNTADDDYQP